MKVTIIEFSYFNGCSMMYATHYYVDGKRVSQNSYYQLDTWIQRNYRHDKTICRSDTNKNGCRRDYTEIYYTEK